MPQHTKYPSWHRHGNGGTTTCNTKSATPHAWRGNDAHKHHRHPPWRVFDNIGWEISIFNLFWVLKKESSISRNSRTMDNKDVCNRKLRILALMAFYDLDFVPKRKFWNEEICEFCPFLSVTQCHVVIQQFQPRWLAPPLIHHHHLISKHFPSLSSSILY